MNERLFGIGGKTLVKLLDCGLEMLSEGDRVNPLVIRRRKKTAQMATFILPASQLTTCEPRSSRMHSTGLNTIYMGMMPEMTRFLSKRRAKRSVCGTDSLGPVN